MISQIKKQTCLLAGRDYTEIKKVESREEKSVQLSFPVISGFAEAKKI